MKNQLIEVSNTYSKNPMLKGLMQLIPFGIGSAIDASLETSINNIQEKRTKLLKNTINDENTDNFEEYLKILDELSYKEIKALIILDSFYKTIQTKEQNDLQYISVFWDKFTKKINEDLEIPYDEIEPYMNRIARSGCYELITGNYFIMREEEENYPRYGQN